MANISRYTGLRTAFEVALRQNELYQAMLIVEQAGCSVELTEAINRLDKRLAEHEAQLAKLTADGVSVSDYPWRRATAQEGGQA